MDNNKKHAVICEAIAPLQHKLAEYLSLEYTAQVDDNEIHKLLDVLSETTRQLLSTVDSVQYDNTYILELLNRLPEGYQLLKAGDKTWTIAKVTAVPGHAYTITPVMPMDLNALIPLISFLATTLKPNT